MLAASREKALGTVEMPALDARAYAEQMLVAGSPNPNWVMQSMAGAPAHGHEHLKYVYISGYRPLPGGALPYLPPGTVTQHSANGTRSVIRASSPIDPSVIARWELTPVRTISIGAFYWATLSDGRKLELSPLGGEESYLIFKNPRGIWQASRFTELGPIGHQEFDSPEEATGEVVASNRVRYANTGAVDSIMENLAKRDARVLEHLS